MYYLLTICRQVVSPSPHLLCSMARGTLSLLLGTMNRRRRWPFCTIPKDPLMKEKELLDQTAGGGGGGTGGAHGTERQTPPSVRRIESPDGQRRKNLKKCIRSTRDMTWQSRLRHSFLPWERTNSSEVGEKSVLAWRGWRRVFWHGGDEERRPRHEGQKGREIHIP